MSVYYQSLVESLLDPVGDTIHDVIYRCPFCEGVKGSGHLYINYDKNVYHCYKCDVGGRDVRTLLLKMGYSFSEDIPSSILSKDRRSTDSKLDNLIREMQEDPKRVTLTRDYSTDLRVCTEYFLRHTVPLSDTSTQYLRGRGLSSEEIDVYGIREGINLRGRKLVISGKEYDGCDYSNRILIPSLHRTVDGVLVSYYVARDITGTSDRKYLNPPSTIAYSSEDVWNLDLVKQIKADTVVICEGVFTAISAGYNAVATYGKSLSERSNSTLTVTSQAEKLLRAGFKTYVVAYDADARDKTDYTCSYLASRGVDVRFVKIPPVNGPHTDLSDLEYEQRSCLISNAVSYNQVSRLDLLL